MIKGVYSPLHLGFCLLFCSALLLSKRKTMTCIKLTSMVEENEKNLQGGNQLCIWQKRKQKYNDKINFYVNRKIQCPPTDF